MVRPKYPEVKERAQRLMKDPDNPNFPFRMKAVQIQELQDMVQARMEVKFPYDDYMQLFQSDLQVFFSEFNNILAKEYGF